MLKIKLNKNFLNKKIVKKNFILFFKNLYSVCFFSFFFDFFFDGDWLNFEGRGEVNLRNRVFKKSKAKMLNAFYHRIRSVKHILSSYSPDNILQVNYKLLMKDLKEKKVRGYKAVFLKIKFFLVNLKKKNIKLFLKKKNIKLFLKKKYISLFLKKKNKNVVLVLKLNFYFFFKLASVFFKNFSKNIIIIKFFFYLKIKNLIFIKKSNINFYKNISKSGLNNINTRRFINIFFNRFFIFFCFFNYLKLINKKGINRNIMKFFSCKSLIFFNIFSMKNNLGLNKKKNLNFFFFRENRLKVKLNSKYNFIFF